MSVLLEAVKLKKSYRVGAHALEVLRGVTLQIQQGELAVIVGPSGAGKSTLLHLLGGLDRPTSGEVRFDGKNLSRLKEREVSQLRSKAFGFVFQFYHLVPELTALENVMLPAWIGRGAPAPRHSLGSKDGTASVSGGTLIRRRAAELLEEVGLSARADHLPAELSGGEQQRVAIARAMMNGPRAIFCDEPTGNLDSATGEGILEILLRLNKEQGTTLVVVTHEPAITKVAGRLFSLKDGQLWD